jgi:hypothetical protein
VRWAAIELKAGRKPIEETVSLKAPTRPPTERFQWLANANQQTHAQSNPAQRAHKRAPTNTSWKSRRNARRSAHSEPAVATSPQSPHLC